MTSSREVAQENPGIVIGGVVVRYSLIIVVAGFVVTLATLGAGRYLYPVLLTAMKDALAINYGQAGALGSAIMIGYLVGCFISGVAAVKLGSRLIISLSTLAVGAAMVGQAFANWYPLNFFLMLVIGLATGGAYIPVAGLVSAWFAPERRGTILGIVTLGAMVGIAATAIFGPMVLASNGGTAWQPAWVYFGITALAAGVLAYAGVRDRHSFGTGAVLQGAARPQPPTRNWGAVFQNRSMVWVTAAYFCHGFFSIYVTFLIAFATRGLHYETQFATGLWSLASVVAAITLIPLGYLSDRLGRKETLIPCAATLMLAILIPIFRQDPASLMISAFLFGCTYIGPMNILTLAAGDLAGPAMAAAAIGLVTMGHGVGQMAGPAIGGFLIDQTGSFYPGLILAATAILAEILIVSKLALPKPKPRGG